MVSARISLFATLRDRYKVGELAVTCNGTVRSLIENAAGILGEDFLNRIYDVSQNKVREDLIFAVNGRSIKDMMEKIEIKEGDAVAIFPLIAGG